MLDEKTFEVGQLVEKTPHHLVFVKNIRSVFPDAHIVLVERDTRDVIASMLYSYFYNFADNFEDAVDKVSMYNRHIDKNLDTFIRIRYEDLSDDTEQALTLLLERLGLEYSDADIATAVEENRGVSKVPVSFRKGVVGSYKTDLTAQQILDIETKFDLSSLVS